jgi:segregation and condensation protein A
MARSPYKVRLDAFEGPLDLLLHLVKTNELDLYDLPIAVITDQYLQYVELFEELNLDLAGEYLVMAATLMYLKSRLLLPLEVDEEGEDEDDPAADLVRQLAEYQRYREAGEELRDRAVLGRDVFRRLPSPPEAAPTDDAGYHRVDLADLFEALRRVLHSAAVRKPHVLSGEEINVGDAVRLMVAHLRSVDRIEFKSLFDSESSRAVIIATFVGLLEMIKMGVIEAEQKERGPIMLRLVEHDSEEAIERLSDTYGRVPAHREVERDGEVGA